ncbi:ATP-dependent RNA helicase HrpA [Hydromonas duriensis]|uniref:ATP-dependent helicase HrpA n=1 Tax=Hydromonas duriensis TaxID=1527608 RepID=A0A4V3DK56_9BURK|nr:ATP-dependent RNA helicase HrpA [Hydromonas duriensis]TDR32817.1 ATP-dependent helicase HrpA [Hydromonas duriensis]
MKSSPAKIKFSATPAQIERLQQSIQFPEQLPVSAEREAICKLIQSNQVVIICGETGSGKTTQLPKMCLSLGRGVGVGGLGLIGHTQPRRLAATSTAKRIAQELDSPLGEVVGYKIRFQDRLHEGASIKLMTDGILLAETQRDPLLKQYDTLIIDEAHERSLNIDFLLGYLKEILPKRKDLKIIITSATIDADRFAAHFATEKGPAPIMNVSGRTYPVEIRYRPIQANEHDKERDLYDGIVDAVDELAREGTGDILVFLPGEREIREAAESLRKHHPPHVDILPLFARLTAQEQERIFKPSNARRIVLATNVAETSLTVPGIRYVIDSGLARVKRYSYRQKVEQLQIEAIAKAAANQRAGRCGRVAAGVCIRLYDEADFVARADFTDPEILRSSLATVILRMKALGLKRIEEFPFVQAPLNRAIVDGYHLLQELGALTDDYQLTQIGRELAKLPIDPRVARMILAARDEGALREVLIIASALSVQDVRDRPTELRAQADSAHAKFNDPASEFLSYLKIWQWFDEAVKHKKSNKLLQENCRAHFLSQLRLREWRDVHTQLSSMVKELGWRINESEPTFEQLHCALLAGLLGNIGFKSELQNEAVKHSAGAPAKVGQRGQYYQGARGIQFYLWPGSSLKKKSSQWVMAAELVETSRLFARTLAKIEPKWLERVGSHLLKKTYSEPRWRKKSGQVQADERATLYGLVVYNHRPVSYARINPEEARAVFIRDGLAQHEFEGRFPFLTHNKQLIAHIENIEHKSRRQDVLVDDELIVAFYDSVIPKDICDIRALQKWHDEAIKTQPKILYLSKDDLMRHEASGVTTDVFPKHMQVGGLSCGLTYHFEPNSPRDGVTLTVPIAVLNQVSAVECEWLVLGMLKNKVLALLKSLPQKIRRHCVPLPDYAQQFIEWSVAEACMGKQALLDALIAHVRLKTGQQLKSTDFKLELLPAHAFMNFKLIDEYGRQLEMSRNLSLLRTHFGGQARESFQEVVQAQSTADDASQSKQAKSTVSAGEAGRAITTWDFGELPELMELQKGQAKIFGYPALLDCETHCELSVWDEEKIAQDVHLLGLLRLARLHFKDSLKHLDKNIPDAANMGMLYAALTGDSLEALKSDIVALALQRACGLDDVTQWPRNAETFEKMLSQAKSRLGLIVQEVSKLVLNILSEWQVAQKKWVSAKAHINAYNDIKGQIERLIPKHFVLNTAYVQLVHYPRYFKAIALRIDKLKNDNARDAQLMRDMLPLTQNWQRAVNERGGQLDDGLLQFRWLLEELRVGLFAQECRTPMPVSVKRLHKVWDSLQR